MAGVNKAIVLGFLGADPEVRHLESGNTVSTFSVATSETWKDKDGNKQEKTSWHRIVLWKGLAEIAEKYLKKGSQVYIEGKMESRSYEDKEGVTKYITEIVGRELVMIGGKGEGGSPVPHPTEENASHSVSKPEEPTQY